MAALLKDLYNKEYIILLSKTILKHHSSFDETQFINNIFNKKWNSLELKERMRHIAITLGVYLPKEYIKTITLLQKIFLDMNHAYSLENMIFQDFVEVYGLDDFENSMLALKCFTCNSSSEFAIRRFIIKYPKESMQEMREWAKSKSEHIRRLSSEGSRSRLPWAIALPSFKDNPSEVLKILELLKDDPSAYVRKSVANNINDISKDNQSIVKTLAKKWFGFSKNRDAILKHGCRTLLKNSDTEILELFGFMQAKNINLQNFTFTQELKMGEDLEFSFDLVSLEQLGKLRIEFSMHFLRQNSKHNKKVFKISEGIYKIKTKKITKKYSFKPISTRVYYKGLHKLDILINGVIFKKVEFNLL